MTLKMFSEWPDGWGIVFAAWASEGTFEGKVKLNKFLSILQREGFPITNCFVNYDMGPYDENIDAQAEKLCTYGFIDTEKKAIGKEKKMVVYKILTRGEELVKKSIIPLIERLPRKGEFIRTFLDTALRFKVEKTIDIVKNVHKELFLDDKVEFTRQLEGTKSRLEDSYMRSQKRFADFCPACLTILGSLEFAIGVLDKIYRYKLRETTTGKNHVLYNAGKLFELVANLEGHEHFHLLMPEEREEDPNFEILEKVQHRLHCIEFNCDVYGIAKPIDSEEYDFVEFLSPQIHS